jgi:hypothetical protein
MIRANLTHSILFRSEIEIIRTAEEPTARGSCACEGCCSKGMGKLPKVVIGRTIYPVEKCREGL